MAVVAPSIGRMPAIGRGAAAAPAPPVTFSTDIASIIYKHCGRCHHPDGPAPFSLLTYQDARQHATQMAIVTRGRLMPPWKAEPGYGDFIGQQPLTDAEIELIQQWVAAGSPEGRRRDLPAAPGWNDGWQLGAPDLVVTLPEPYLLRPDGPDMSRIFVLRLPVDSIRFVRGFEFRPGNARAVHHANFRVDRTPASRELDDQDPLPGYEGALPYSAVYPDGHFLGWTPGQVAPLLPKGLSWTLNPGTDLVVEMHLVPDGKVEAIQPAIGLYFTEDPPGRTPTMLRLGKQSIDIPAGEKAYAITDSFVLPVDVEVQAVQPHAHYRAREIKGTATLPDGTTTPLIYIKDWDFRWQHVYRYVHPFTLPKGTTVAMEYLYDNSAGNPRNPRTPPERVLWGQRTTDEMGDLWVQMLTRDDRDRQTLNAAMLPKELIEDVTGYEVMLRRDPSNVQFQDDAGVLYLKLGRPLQAAAHFGASARLKPGSAAAHFNFGTALALAARPNEAMAEFARALEIKPDYPQAHNNLGDILMRTDHVEQAVPHFREALRLDPQNGEANFNLGSAARMQGDVPEAIVQFRRAVRLRPDAALALEGLAWLLATAPEPSLRSPEEAVRLAEHAADLTAHHDAAALDILAAASAAAGDFDRAVAASQAALDLKPAGPLASAIRNRLELYAQRRAYIAPAAPSGGNAPR
jgi:Tfp pilus assembly protein PilF/mono/diheme cytochrome c family protein